MRSRPYSPPPPLPPILSTYLPNRDPLKDSRHRRVSEDGLPLRDLDPESSRLLPQRKRGTHHVRIQGKLAPVRSVSVANPRSRSADCRASSPLLLRDEAPRCVDAAVGGMVLSSRSRRRRRSEDDTESETEEEIRERDTQLRGYGIGGAGNIRRATDVIGTSSRTSSLSLSSLFSNSSSTSPSSPGPDRRWKLSGLLDRIEERRARDKGR
ncbi:hypothetical protein GGR53DRAFT_140935 [Hypoxylon sp. FL1150]|nr:hypothetical protein GGR53DRAFT_140935 [Hypoxylon sp. FL1150]